MRTIPLTRGLVAIVDDDDHEWLSQWKWHAVGRPAQFYAARTKRLDEGGPGVVLMHRVVMGLVKDEVLFVDHANHDSLDNRRSNLRLCEHRINLANQRSSSGSSRYKGVYYLKGPGTWRAEISVNKRKFCLGNHKTQESAGKAYDEAALAAWGEFAYLNFPS